MRSPRALFVSAALALACDSRGEPPACLAQRQEARKLALRGELEPARRLLDQVKQSCGANSQSDIQHITKLIAEKAAARDEQRRRAELERAELERSPSRSFVEWATARGGAIAGKVGEVRCGERGAADFGYCEGERPGVPAMRLRYSEAQPEAYRYALVTPVPPSCQDLGEHRQVRAWTREGVDYELCELTQLRLRHLTALIVRAAAGYEMYVFSQSYPNVDAAFERRLRRVGP